MSSIVRRTSIGIFLILLMSTTAPASAQDHSDDTEPIVLPINISLVPGISIGDAVAKETDRPIVNKVSFNVLAGQAYALEGVEFGSVWNAYTGYVRGAQFGGMINTVDGPMRGAQFSGVGNFVGGSVTGFQSAGVVNTSADVSGIQWSGVLSLARGRVSGLQASGIAGLADGDVDAQFSGLLSLTHANVRGVQASGFVNLAGADVGGVQIGGLANIARGEVSGVQIGGLVNTAPYVSGLQVGVVNVARAHDGVPIGLVSYVDDVGIAVDVWADETGGVFTAVRSGTRSVSNYLGGGALFGAGEWQWAIVAGLGYDFGISGRASGSVDVITQSMHTEEFTDWAGITRLRFVARYWAHPNVAVFAGPTFNTYYSNHTDGSEVAPWTVYETSSSDFFVRMWPGFNAGVRIAMRAN